MLFLYYFFHRFLPSSYFFPKGSLRNVVIQIPAQVWSLGVDFGVQKKMPPHLEDFFEASVVRCLLFFFCVECPDGSLDFFGMSR